MSKGPRSEMAGYPMLDEPEDLRMHVCNTFFHVFDANEQMYKLPRSRSESSLSQSSGDGMSRQNTADRTWNEAAETRNSQTPLLTRLNGQPRVNASSDSSINANVSSGQGFPRQQSGSDHVVWDGIEVATSDSQSQHEGDRQDEAPNIPSGVRFIETKSENNSERSGSEQANTDPPKLGENASSEMPSVGSAEHDAGKCAPCSFFMRSRCMFEDGCNYCHMPHVPKPQRPGKKKRERMRKKNGNGGNGANENDDDDDGQGSGQEEEQE